MNTSKKFGPLILSIKLRPFNFFKTFQKSSRQQQQIEPDNGNNLQETQFNFLSSIFIWSCAETSSCFISFSDQIGSHFLPAFFAAETG